jgi:serine/threonine protein kinase
MRPHLGSLDPLIAGDPPRVGRYELLGRLGAGGMGTVYLGRYLGRDAGSDEFVAVKVIRPELAVDSSFRARFRDEAAVARSVAAFCTAAVLDANPDADPPYIVTEYIDGVPLDHVVPEKGRLPQSTLHGVAVGVATALAAIHAVGLVHRDLKPSNILLTLSGPRVIDFGIARSLTAPGGHTMAGVVIGTPGWMAPEQLLGERATPAADVFAWGCLVVYAATGRNPWSEGTPTAVAHAMLHEPPDLSGIQGSLRPLVEAALRRDPARRPAARELVLSQLGEGTAIDPDAAVTRLLERTWTPLPAGPAGPMPPPTKIAKEEAAGAAANPDEVSTEPVAPAACGEPEAAPTERLKSAAPTERLAQPDGGQDRGQQRNWREWWSPPRDGWAPPQAPPKQSTPTKPAAMPSQPPAAPAPWWSAPKRSTPTKPAAMPSGPSGPSAPSAPPGPSAPSGPSAPPGPSAAASVPSPPSAAPPPPPYQSPQPAPPYSPPAQQRTRQVPPPYQPPPRQPVQPYRPPPYQGPVGPWPWFPPQGLPAPAGQPGGHGPTARPGVAVPPYVPPQLPRRRRRWRRWLLLVIIVLVLLNLVSRWEEALYAISTPPTPTVEVGDTARDRAFAFSVQDVECGRKTIGTESTAGGLQWAAGRFCVVDLRVRNVTGKGRALPIKSQVLHDTAGDYYRPDREASQLQGGDDLLDPIAPGETARGTLVYELPATRTAEFVALHDWVLSPGVGVKI